MGGDLAIDLEVTSNRPDCLGHLGVAREIAVLFDAAAASARRAARRGPTPAWPSWSACGSTAPSFARAILARVVRGLKVGPSPRWLTERLATVGIAAINNVVDISNYVLMECGQPLHIVRLRQAARAARSSSAARVRARRIEAIDHKTYTLEPDMCVIADARGAVAIAGVMGGAATEVSRRDHRGARRIGRVRSRSRSAPPPGG